MDDDPHRHAVAFLSAFQRDFTAVLRTPLEASTGTRVAASAQYPTAFVARVEAPRPGAAPEGLAAYNRQYYVRLFAALQDLYPLFSRLVGLWSFNQLAEDFLQVCPPTHRDLRHAGDGLTDFLRERIEGPIPDPPPSWLRQTRAPRASALLEAIAIDDAWAHVWFAPRGTSLRIDEEALATLGTRRLTLRADVRVVCEHWPLLELRRALLHSSEEGPVALPEAYAGPHFVALVPTADAITEISLSAFEARLLELLEAHTVEASLLAATADGLEVEVEAIQRFFARGAQAGWWRDG